MFVIVTILAGMFAAVSADVFMNNIVHIRLQLVSTSYAEVSLQACLAYFYWKSSEMKATKPDVLTIGDNGDKEEETEKGRRAVRGTKTAAAVGVAIIIRVGEVAYCQRDGGSTQFFSW